MKVAIISDVHENFHNLIVALEAVDKEECEQIIFLGDFINNGVANILAKSGISTKAIWGNNDGDKSVITKTSLVPGSSLSMSDNTYDFLEVGSRKIFITHYPDLARPMAESGRFDAVFYGHNHLKNEERIGNCVLANPGEISAHKTGQATFIVYDTGDNTIRFVMLEGIVTLLTEKVQKYLEEIEFKFNKTKQHQV